MVVVCTNQSSKLGSFWRAGFLTLTPPLSWNPPPIEDYFIYTKILHCRWYTSSFASWRKFGPAGCCLVGRPLGGARRRRPWVVRIILKQKCDEAWFSQSRQSPSLFSNSSEVLSTKKYRKCAKYKFKYCSRKKICSLLLILVTEVRSRS